MNTPRHVMILGQREDVNQLTAAVAKVRGRGVVMNERQCGCGCHYAMPERWHCFGNCCIAPNLLYGKVILHESIRSLTTR